MENQVMVLVTERPDKARQLILDANERDRAGYASVGNAVASAKELTLCLIAGWLRRQARKEGLVTAPQERDDTGYLQPLIGTAVERILFENPGQRVITHVMGDRGRNSRPKVIVRDLEFSVGELREWHAEVMRRLNLVLGDVQPGFGEHYNWECGYCEFKQSGV